MPGVKRRAALPQPIRTLVDGLPRVPLAAVVAAALNLTIRRRLPAAVFDQFGERQFSIELRDLDLVMAFRCRGHRFFPASHAGEAALRVRLNAAALATLAQPDEVPVEPFLNDLEIVGDPGLAPAFRRALTGIDVLRARRILRRTARRFSSTRAHA